MSTKNSRPFAFLNNFKERFLNIMKIIQKSLTNFSIKYPNLSEIIQLSFIYYFALRWLFGLFYSF